MTRHANHRSAQNFGSKGDHDKDGKVGGAAPAINTEEPSQLKNNIDQVLQPTGDGGIAGGELPPVGEAGNEPAEPAEVKAGKKMVTMKLDKNYRPEGEFEVVGTPPAAVLAGTGTDGKLWAGTTLKLTEAEAKKVHAAKIASRDFD